MENPRAVIGSNSAGLEDALARFDLVGFMLARLETLSCAVRDDRLDRACLKVLAALIETMNRDTRTSWVGRDRLAEICGISAKSAGNYVYQLKALGYVVGERRQTPQADNRVLMHYTLVKLSPEEIEAQINRAIGSIRGITDSIVAMPIARQDRQSQPESARQDGQYVPAATGKPQEVPARTGKQVPAGTGTACGDGQSQPENACQDGQKAESARQDGCSTIDTKKEEREEEKKKSKQPRGTRLSPEWRLPKSWGEWALAECVITEQQVRREAKNFLDYWTELTGAKATKVSWQGTWRNWIRRTYPDRDASGPSGKPQKQRTEEEIKKSIESTGAVFEKGDPNALIG